MFDIYIYIYKRKKGEEDKLLYVVKNWYWIFLVLAFDSTAAFLVLHYDICFMYTWTKEKRRIDLPYIFDQGSWLMLFFYLVFVLSLFLTPLKAFTLILFDQIFYYIWSVVITWRLFLAIWPIHLYMYRMLYYNPTCPLHQLHIYVKNNMLHMPYHLLC